MAASQTSPIFLIKENFKKRPSVTEKQAEAMAVVYLAVAFNPKREKMLSNNKELLNHLGLSATSPHKYENLAAIQQLVADLKENATSTRINILHAMKSALVTKPYGELTDNLDEEVVQFLQAAPFNLKREELVALVNTCNKGLNFLIRENKHNREAFEGTVLFSLLVGVGSITVTAPLGTGLMLGIIALTAITTGLLVYAAYRLINAIIRNYDYNAAATDDSTEKLAHSVAGFMRESRPEGDLSNLNQETPFAPPNYVMPASLVK